MTHYAASLRGVNVGGVNLKMADVATALTDAGLADVRTILANTPAGVIGKTMGKKKYNPSTTTRHLRTLVKVSAAQSSA